jgi:hypothetical protein
VKEASTRDILIASLVGCGGGSSMAKPVNNDKELHSPKNGADRPNNNSNNNHECHSSILELLLLHENVMQRLETSSLAIQNLQSENTDMKSFVSSTRDHLSHLKESLKSERDRAFNKESHMEIELQELRTKVQELEEQRQREITASTTIIINNNNDGNSTAGVPQSAKINQPVKEKNAVPSSSPTGVMDAWSHTTEIIIVSGPNQDDFFKPIVDHPR